MKISSANTSADSLNKRRYNSATTNQQTQNYERRSKTLLQQAKYYEVHNEMEMMCLIWEAWVNGNFSDFKSYYRSLNMESHRRFIGFIYNQVDGHTFYKMVDMLMFDKR